MVFFYRLARLLIKYKRSWFSRMLRRRGAGSRMGWLIESAAALSSSLAPGGYTILPEKQRARQNIDC